MFLVVLFSQQPVLKISITAVVEAVIVIDERVETLAEIKRTNTIPSKIAPAVNRRASKAYTGRLSSAFFIMKKEVPQIRAAENSIGLASFLITSGDMIDSSPICKFAPAMVI